MDFLIIAGILILGFAVLGIFNWWQNRGPSLTGTATVLSRRVEHGRASSGKYNNRGSWNYYITFRLSDGEEIELNAMEYWFSTLKEGMTGQLTWCREQLYDFEEDA